jgi:hypothetical protein
MFGIRPPRGRMEHPTNNSRRENITYAIVLCYIDFVRRAVTISIGGLRKIDEFQSQGVTCSEELRGNHTILHSSRAADYLHVK